MTTILRSFAFALPAMLLLGVAAAQPADSPPSTPTGLSASSYSSTAGAIAWARSTDDRLVVGYEVTRDGRVLGVFDALSRVDRSLRPARAYRYTVVAIDSIGQRSAPASVWLWTPAARPAAPTGFRAEVYSPLVVGLFGTPRADSASSTRSSATVYGWASRPGRTRAFATTC